MTESNDTKLLETIEDTAERLNLSRSTIYELLRANELEAVKIGKSRRVVVDSSRKYVERLRAAAAQAKQQETA